MNHAALTTTGSRQEIDLVDLPYPCVGTPGEPSIEPVATAAASLAILFRTQVAETFAPPRMVFAQGDEAEHVFYVIDGWLRICRLRQDGSRAIVGFVCGGDVLGISFRGAYLFTAEAVTSVKLKRHPYRRFHALVDQSPDLRPQLLTKICDEMAAAQDQLVLLGATRAEERLAGFLLSIASRTGADKRTPVEVELPFGRVDIADHLGITVETVCRAFSKLKRDGLISMRGPHKIFLRHVHGLRETAGVDDE
jgi:CRP/FNR family transcriptional regulator, anaerobic regulatory protein